MWNFSFLVEDRTIDAVKGIYQFQHQGFGLARPFTNMIGDCKLI